MIPSPSELDKQCAVKIDKWVDINSEECRELDDNIAFTKKVIRIGFQEPSFLFTDNDGRVWGKPSNSDNLYYPFHFEAGKRLIGIRIAKKALN